MNQPIAQQTEKRKKVSLSKEEKDVIISLLLKASIPITIIVIISSTALFFGFHFLMKKTGFANFGLNPYHAVQSVSQFISTYMVIALINVFLIILLSITVLYLTLHNIILPIMRITRNLKNCIDTNSRSKICVRDSDKLFVPLIDMINKLLHKQ